MPGLTPQLNLLLASCHERRGDFEAQMEALRRALTAAPNHLAARVALANAFLNAGRLDDALKEYQTATKSPFAGLGVKCTALSLRMTAAKIGNASADEWKAIAAAIARLREENKSAIEPAILSAERWAAQGNFAAAAKTLREEVAVRPGDPRLWSALAAIVCRGQGVFAATEIIGEGKLAAGDSIDLRLARARIWADDFLPGRSQRLAQLEQLSPTTGDADRARLLNGLAEIYAVTHDDAGRLRVLTALAGQDRQNLELRKTLYALALRGNRELERTHWRDEIRRIEGPNGRSVAVLDALQQMTTGTAQDPQLSDWQDLGRVVVNESPDDVDARLLTAAIAKRRGDDKSAMQNFDMAARMEPGSIRCQEARLGYLLRTGHDEIARNCLLRLTADPRLNSLRIRGIVEGAIQQGGRGTQSKCLTWLADEIKREPRTALWAGQLLEKRAKFTDALSLYGQINQTNPEFTDAWSARLIVSARLGKVEVDDTLAAATKALDRKAFFAVCAESGPLVRAKLSDWSPPIHASKDRRLYAQACLTVCENRGRLDDAIPVLKSVAEAKDGKPDDVAWARRTLAAIAAARGTAEQKRNALAILREGDRPNTIAEIRSRIGALLVAYRTVSGDDRRIVRSELIELFGRVVRDDSATSKDWFQLAQLYRVAGDRAHCRGCLDELMKARAEESVLRCRECGQHDCR